MNSDHAFRACSRAYCGPSLIQNRRDDGLLSVLFAARLHDQVRVERPPESGGAPRTVHSYGVDERYLLGYLRIYPITLLWRL